MGEVWADPRSRRFVRFDAHTGEVLEQSKPPGQQRQTFIGLMLRLHMDLFARVVHGRDGALFVAAIVSGGVLYGPFTRKLAFGTVRAGRSSRIGWLDLHNQLAVVTIACSCPERGGMKRRDPPTPPFWC